uniref:glucuronosyltransferase n=1 Tax=Acrobeloides nanus TaxID=290746 RepID=A0A914DMB6_9BILA
MVCIPIFADQLRNAKMVEYRKIGVTLNKDSLTTEDFTAAINEILENDKYRKNAKRLKSMIEKKPMSAEERIIKYTEFAAKFGPDLNLDLYGQHLNFVQFYCLDIIVPVFLLAILVIYFAYRLLRSLLRKISAFLVSSKSKIE